MFARLLLTPSLPDFRVPREIELPKTRRDPAYQAVGSCLSGRRIVFIKPPEPVYLRYISGRRSLKIRHPRYEVARRLCGLRQSMVYGHGVLGGSLF
jgi:hypothetical protein